MRVRCSHGCCSHDPPRFAPIGPHDAASPGGPERFFRGGFSRASCPGTAGSEGCPPLFQARTLLVGIPCVARFGVTSCVFAAPIAKLSGPPLCDREALVGTSPGRQSGETASMAVTCHAFGIQNRNFITGASGWGIVPSGESVVGEPEGTQLIDSSPHVK